MEASGTCTFSARAEGCVRCWCVVGQHGFVARERVRALLALVVSCRGSRNYRLLFNAKCMHCVRSGTARCAGSIASTCETLTRRKDADEMAFIDPS